jgi:hypothetical protein
LLEDIGPYQSLGVDHGPHMDPYIFMWNGKLKMWIVVSSINEVSLIDHSVQCEDQLICPKSPVFNFGVLINYPHPILWKTHSVLQILI